MEVNYWKHSFRMQPSCLDRVPPYFQCQYVPNLWLCELSFIEGCYLKHFPSILIAKVNRYLSLLAEFLCTFEFQAKINFCYVVMHLNIFKLLQTVKLGVMLPIFVPAAILFMNRMTICILVIYFSLPTFSFSAVCPPLQLHNSP